MISYIPTAGGRDELRLQGVRLFAAILCRTLLTVAAVIPVTLRLLHALAKRLRRRFARA